MKREKERKRENLLVGYYGKESESGEVYNVVG